MATSTAVLEKQFRSKCPPASGATFCNPRFSSPQETKDGQRRTPHNCRTDGKHRRMSAFAAKLRPTTCRRALGLRGNRAPHRANRRPRSLPDCQRSRPTPIGRHKSFTIGRSPPLAGGRGVVPLDADADILANPAQTNRVVVHVSCSHRNSRVTHEAGHRLDVHAALDQRCREGPPPRVT